jgi:hypothetical protein
MAMQGIPISGDGGLDVGEVRLHVRELAACDDLAEDVLGVGDKVGVTAAAEGELGSSHGGRVLKVQGVVKTPPAGPQPLWVKASIWAVYWFANGGTRKFVFELKKTDFESINHGQRM